MIDLKTGEPIALPGWVQCPTCKSRQWRQWADKDLTKVLRDQVHRVGGLHLLAARMGVPEANVDRIAKGIKVQERTLLEVDLALQRETRIRPLRVSIGDGAPHLHFGPPPLD